MNEKGFSVFELLVTLSILALVTGLTVSSLSGFGSSLKFRNQVRDLQSALQTARYKAVYENRPIRFSIEAGHIVLQARPGATWQDEISIPIKKGLSVSLNARPVFQPQGSASPLCSIVVEDSIRRAVITLSMAGRVSTRRG